MTYDEIIAFYGTARRAASKLGVTPPALAMWKRRGCIPDGRQALIHIQTRGRLKADKPEMVPQ